MGEKDEDAKIDQVISIQLDNNRLAVWSWVQAPTDGTILHNFSPVYAPPENIPYFEPSSIHIIRLTLLVEVQALTVGNVPYSQHGQYMFVMEIL